MSQIPAQEGHQAQGSPWERGWVQEWDRWGRQRCLCSVVFLFLLKAPVPPSPAETPKIAFGAVSHCELSLAQVSQPKLLFADHAQNRDLARWAWGLGNGPEVRRGLLHQ